MHLFTICWVRGELPHPLCFDIFSKRDRRSIKYSTNIRHWVRGELPHPLCFDISSKRDRRSIKYSTNIRPIYLWLIMGSYKKIGLSHEMGLIDTPPFDIRVIWPMESCEMETKLKLYSDAPRKTKYELLTHYECFLTKHAYQQKARIMLYW